MPAVRLTESNIIFIKKKVRDLYPSMRSATSSEFVANLFGFKTNMALKAAQRVDEESYERIVYLSDDLYLKRKQKLGFPEIDIQEIYQLVLHENFPDPVWKTFASNEVSWENNQWYRYCRGRNLPFVYIAKERTTYLVHYDGISIDPPYDDPFHDFEQEKSIRESICNAIEKICSNNKSKWDYHAGAFVGTIYKASMSEAKLIADFVFQTQYDISQKEILLEKQSSHLDKGATRKASG